MASASVTVTTAACYIPELWTDWTLEAIRHQIVVMDRVDRSLEVRSEIKKHGDTVHVPRRSNMTATAKTAGIGNTVAYEAITENAQTLTVATHEYTAQAIEDPAKIQSSPELMEDIVGRMVYPLRRSIEVDITGLFASFSQTAGILGSELTDDDLLDAFEILAEASANIEETSIFVSPATYTGLLKIDKFISRDYGAESAVQKAKIGEIYKAPVFMTNLLVAPATGQSEGAWMHKNQIYLVVQMPPKKVSMYDPDILGFKVAYEALWGQAEVNRPPETAGGGTAVDTWGVLLRANN